MGETTSNVLKENVSLFWIEVQNSIYSILTILAFFVVSTICYYFTENWGKDIGAVTYFLVVTITTVGYGDLAPQTQKGKLITIFVILFGIGFVFNAINSILSPILESTHKMLESQMSHDTSDDKFEEEMDSMRAKHTRSFCIWVLTILIMLTAWAFIFWYCQPEEGVVWTLIDSFYFCIVTATTVGYGDLIVQSNSERGLVVGFVLTSVVIFSAAIGVFSSIAIERSAAKTRLDALARPLDFEMLRTLDKTGDGIDLPTFLSAMLTQTVPGFNAEKDFMPWVKRFQELDADNSGKLDDQDIAVLQQKALDDLNSRLQLVQHVEIKHKNLRNRGSLRGSETLSSKPASFSADGSTPDANELTPLTNTKCEKYEEKV